jgi:hypothetical protein
MQVDAVGKNEAALAMTTPGAAGAQTNRIR